MQTAAKVRNSPLVPKCVCRSTDHFWVFAAARCDWHLCPHQLNFSSSFKKNMPSFPHPTSRTEKPDGCVLRVNDCRLDEPNVIGKGKLLLSPKGSLIYVSTCPRHR